MSIRDYYSLGSRIGNALESYAFYIQKTLWPTDLAPFYPHPGENISILSSAMAAAFLLGVTLLVLRLGRTHRYLPVGWFWYLGVLVPVIGLVQVGEQARADRYSYVAIVGLFIIVAWGTPQLLSKWPSRGAVLTGLSMVTIAVLSFCAYKQQQYWRNSILLFEHAIAATKENYHAHLCLAEPLRKAGRFEESIYHSEACLRIRPGNTEALNSMGLAKLGLGRFEEAIGHFEKAISIKPDLYASYLNLGIALAESGRYDEAITVYRKIPPHFDEPDVHGNLATALRGKGNKEEAIREYKKFLAFEPSNAAAHYSVGVLLAELNRNTEAAVHLKKALETAPDSLEAHNSLGYVLAQQGQYDEALQHYREALRIAPVASEVHINIAYVFVAQEKFDLAADEYRKALELRPDDYVAHTYLGAVLFRLGKRQEALSHYRRALEINPDYPKARNDLKAIESLAR